MATTSKRFKRLQFFKKICRFVQNNLLNLVFIVFHQMNYTENHAIKNQS